MEMYNEEVNHLSKIISKASGVPSRFKSVQLRHLLVGFVEIDYIISTHKSFLQINITTCPWCGARVGKISYAHLLFECELTYYCKEQFFSIVCKKAMIHCDIRQTYSNILLIGCDKGANEYQRRVLLAGHLSFMNALHTGVHSSLFRGDQYYIANRLINKSLENFCRCSAGKGLELQWSKHLKFAGFLEGQVENAKLDPWCQGVRENASWEAGFEKKLGPSLDILIDQVLERRMLNADVMS